MCPEEDRGMLKFRVCLKEQSSWWKRCHATKTRDHHLTLLLGRRAILEGDEKMLLVLRKHGWPWNLDVKAGHGFEGKDLSLLRLRFWKNCHLGSWSSLESGQCWIRGLASSWGTDTYGWTSRQGSRATHRTLDLWDHRLAFLTIRYGCVSAGALQPLRWSKGKTEGKCWAIPVVGGGHPPSAGTQGVQGYEMSYHAADSSAQRIWTCR